MKSALFFFTLMATMTLVIGFVCPHDYCDKVQCVEVTAKTCVGKVVSKGSTCGCCDSCVTVLEAGQNCFGLLLMGYAPTIACPDGYFCDSTTISCQPQVS
ncbi:unnamed protein product [Candidula unifasciata]|uniref:Uncharacterized protein n=1 Tax=Candidula unifasciata TaxID=100452 RepID=A0A8S3Z2W2_9EUPU|nr:unnamed protein product [Candidula unifasciata]